MAVRVAVHHPSPDSTWDNWLDSTPDLSCTDSTRAYCVDGEHQPTDLVGSEGNGAEKPPKGQSEQVKRREDGRPGGGTQMGGDLAARTGPMTYCTGAETD